MTGDHFWKWKEARNGGVGTERGRLTMELYLKLQLILQDILKLEKTFRVSQRPGYDILPLLHGFEVFIFCMGRLASDLYPAH